MSAELERLRRLLGGVELAPLRRRLRTRLERSAQGEVFTLKHLNDAERGALEGLLGRSAKVADSMQLRQSELDAALARAGLAASLRLALELLDGPLHDRKTERLARERAWSELAGHETDARLRALVADATGFGLLKRGAGGDPARAGELLGQVRRVLARLPARGVPLAHLAAEALGDSHALDSGRAVATLVLRALGMDSVSEGAPAAVQTRLRDQWARVGVSVNELAAPVLCLNLPARPDTPAGGLLCTAAALGEPLHLTLRVLLRKPLSWNVASRTVFVCENPSIVAMAADRLGTRCASLVCTEGMPAAAQRILLTQLSVAGAQLRYHGDFDWPGLRIANFTMREFHALPWRFGTQDYLSARAEPGVPLVSGERIGAEWDAHLANAMAERGSAVHEESVVEDLLADLKELTSG